MAISAAEMLRRLKPVTKITVLREMVYDEILKQDQILLDTKQDLYEKGNIYSNNTTSRYKWAEYGNMKYEMNPQAGGNVDLILSGNFIESFYLLKPRQNRYLFGATDSKTSKLIGQYGADIMSFPQDLFEYYQRSKILNSFIISLKTRANI